MAGDKNEGVKEAEQLTEAETKAAVDEIPKPYAIKEIDVGDGRVISVRAAGHHTMEKLMIAAKIVDGPDPMFVRKIAVSCYQWGICNVRVPAGQIAPAKAFAGEMIGLAYSDEFFDSLPKHVLVEAANWVMKSAFVSEVQGKV